MAHGHPTMRAGVTHSRARVTACKRTNHNDTMTSSLVIPALKHRHHYYSSFCDKIINRVSWRHEARPGGPGRPRSNDRADVAENALDNSAKLAAWSRAQSRGLSSTRQPTALWAIWSGLRGSVYTPKGVASNLFFRARTVGRNHTPIGPHAFPGRRHKAHIISGGHRQAL